MRDNNLVEQIAGRRSGRMRASGELTGGLPELPLNSRLSDSMGRLKQDRYDRQAWGSGGSREKYRVLQRRAADVFRDPDLLHVAANMSSGLTWDSDIEEYERVFDAARAHHARLKEVRAEMEPGKIISEMAKERVRERDSEGRPTWEERDPEPSPYLSQIPAGADTGDVVQAMAAARVGGSRHRPAPERNPQWDMGFNRV